MKLKKQRLPDRPVKFTASELLHGDIDGFIINAYLAMQRQWPDDGGFAHYKHVLVKSPGDRAAVLRELASSQTSRHLGSMLVDDLSTEYQYDPHAFDPVQSLANYQAVSNRLRLLQVIHELRQTREVLSTVTLEGISGAVQTIVDTALGSLSVLDSRLAEVETGFEALRAQKVAAVAEEPGALDQTPPPELSEGDAAELAWLRHEVVRMGRRMQALEERPVPEPVQVVQQVQQVGEAGPQLDALRGEVAFLKDVVMPLHHFATVELKRQMADYVNAMVLAHAEVVKQEAAARIASASSVSPKVEDVL